MYNEIDPAIETNICAQLWAYVGKWVKDPKIVSRIIAYCYQDWDEKPEKVKLQLGSKYTWLKLSAKRILTNYLIAMNA